MCLPGDARLQFACMSLQEMLAVMSHTLSGAKEAWGSLDVDARLVWVPRTTMRLSELGLAAPEHWRPHLERYGWLEFSNTSKVSPQAMTDTDASVLSMFARAFPEEVWAKSTLPLLPIGSDGGACSAKAVHAPLSLQPTAPAVKPEIAALHALPSAVKHEPVESLESNTSKISKPAGEARVGVDRNVAGRLLRNLPDNPIGKSTLEYAQVLRLGIGCARSWFGSSWSEHIAVVNCGDMSTYSFQQSAPLLCGLIYDHSHWALLAWDKLRGHAVVYDSQPNETCYDHACAFLSQVREDPQVSHGPCVVPKLPVRAQTPKQPDGWSCGHRCVLAMDLAMESAKNSLPLPTNVHASRMSPANINSLIQSSVRYERIKRECVEDEGKAQDSRGNRSRGVSVIDVIEEGPAAYPNSPNGPNIPSIPHIPSTPPRKIKRSRSQPNSSTPENPDMPAAARRRGLDGLDVPGCSAFSPNSASPASTPRGKLTRASRPPGSKRPGTGGIASTPGSQQKKTRKEKQALAHAVIKGTEICEEAGLLHRHFQKEHVGDVADCKTGHWHAFLHVVAFAATPDVFPKVPALACATCRRLKAKVLDSRQGPGNVQLVPLEGEGSQANQAMVQGRQVHLRGRPKKSEKAGDRWSIHIFIAQERSWCYDPTEKTYSSDVMYFCRACDRKIKFTSATCKQKIDKHERSETHQKGVRKLRPELAMGVLHDQDAGGTGEVADPSDRDAVQSVQVVPVVHQAAAQVVAYTCPGAVPPTLPDSATKFFQAGQPRTVFMSPPAESDPLRGCQFLCVGSTCSTIAVKAANCARDCRRVDVACKHCKALVKDKAFCRHLAGKAYHIDLVRLAWAYFHASPEEVIELRKSMEQADYYVSGLAGQDLSALTKAASKVEIIGKIRHKITCMPSWRISPSMRAWLDANLVETNSFHHQDSQAEAHAALAASLSGAIAKGKVYEQDIQLASIVAAGGLRADSLINSMVTSFLSKLQQSCAKRHTTSEFMDQAAMYEAVSTLGRGKDVQALFARFGMNPQSLPKLDFGRASLPQSYISMRDPAILGEAFTRIARLLRAPGERMHLLIDETTWSKDLQQVRGLMQGEDRLVGGCWDRDPGQDWSDLDPEVWSKKQVPGTALAKTALHFVLQRKDTARWTFDLCHVPRPTAIGSSQLIIEITAELLRVLTERNGGIPPSGCAFDGGTGNSRLALALCGLLPQREMAALPWFRNCVAWQPPFRFWPFSVVRYKGDKEDFLLLCNNGSWHIAKRFALQHSCGGRKIRWGGWVCRLKLPLAQQGPRSGLCVHRCHERQTRCHEAESSIYRTHLVGAALAPTSSDCRLTVFMHKCLARFQQKGNSIKCLFCLALGVATQGLQLVSTPQPQRVALTSNVQEPCYDVFTCCHLLLKFCRASMPHRNCCGTALLARQVQLPWGAHTQRCPIWAAESTRATRATAWKNDNAAN